MTDQAALEAERDFLLRSLDDLESERDAGNIDDETYRTLHEDYTARAAEVIRSLRDDTEPVRVEAGGTSRRTKVIAIVCIAAFVGVTAYGLTRALSPRSPGDTITGNSDSDTSGQSDEEILADLAQASADAPDSYDARIAYARMLLGSDLAQALREFDAAAELDPSQPEPPTYVGWINALAARALDPGPDRDALIARAHESLDQALALDPSYQDAYVYRALLNSTILNDPAAAIPDFQQFLRLAPPDHPMRALVEGALADAETATANAGPPTTVAGP
jgi:cytochrome c-type biogenesis protein CcmH/NrfG